MSNILQEIEDFESYKEYLKPTLRKKYEKQLYKQLFQEVRTDELYDVFIKKYGYGDMNQRLNMFISVFKNFKYREKDKLPTTDLQLENGSFCTKKEFENEFLKYEYDKNIDAKKLLKKFTDLFDENGRLM